MARKYTLRVLVALLLVQAVFVYGEELDPAAKLVSELSPLLDVLSGKAEKYTLQAEFSAGGTSGTATVGRAGPRDFWLSIKTGRDVEGTLSISPSETRLDIAPKNVAFVGKGELAEKEGMERIQPAELLEQAAKLSTATQMALPILQNVNRDAIAGALSVVLDVEGRVAGNGVTQFKISRDKMAPITLQIRRDAEHGNFWQAEVRMAGGTKDAPAENVIKLSISNKAERSAAPEGRKEVAVPRAELERALQRGGLRAVDILNDDIRGRAPLDSVTDIPGARLEVAHGQRVMYLTGTPAERGREHGKLLKNEIRKMGDSTLFVVGTYYSIAKGQWFLNDIRAAWKRLEPFSEKEYIEEIDGIAEGAGVDRDEMRLANFFPELFHCSGFAIANEATVGGKLFHGRVLDYMTEIGLQHAQVDIISRAPGKRAFVNVGYAGFVGCVTGMNDAQISMGEMGGRGEGNWDGTPMAFLMRRVLENAETLEQAREILEKAKRTCEYYYVVADGKTRTAYGVAAWPEKIQFLKQGEAHELLPSSVPGCVLLSAGQRYLDLTQRTKDGFGKLDEEGAIKLMSRPVSMTSNLHSVLFVPEDQVYHAAHASLRGHKPASETKYVKHDFKEQVKVLKEIEEKKVTAQTK